MFGLVCGIADRTKNLSWCLNWEGWSGKQCLYGMHGKIFKKMYLGKQAIQKLAINHVLCSIGVYMLGLASEA